MQAATLSASKFSPSRFDAALHVPRTHLIHQLTSSNIDRKRVILISRRPIILSPELQVSHDTFIHVIGNEDLALTKSEIAELYAAKMELAVSTEHVHALHSHTKDGSWD